MEVVRKESVNGRVKPVPVKGSWVVHRTTKDGRVVTRHRFPSDQERQRNRERERKRRFVTRKIFSGLRVFGNYKVPKNADTIDLLKALCDEAGWHVEEDGTVYRKHLRCFCWQKVAAECGGGRAISSEMGEKDDGINFKLSLALGTAFD